MRAYLSSSCVFSQVVQVDEFAASLNSVLAVVAREQSMNPLQLGRCKRGSTHIYKTTALDTHMYTLGMRMRCCFAAHCLLSCNVPLAVYSHHPQ